MSCAAFGSPDDIVAEVKRDGPAIDAVRKMALLPVIVQVRYDQSKDVPNVDAIAARFAAAEQIGPMLEVKMRARSKTFLPVELPILAMKAKSLTAGEICNTKSASTWSSPAQHLQNRTKDEATLLCHRAQLNAANETTPFSITFHGIPGIRYGVAAFGPGVDSSPDVPKIADMNKKIQADGLLFCELSDVDDREGLTYRLTAPLLYGFREVRSTRVHIHCTLIRPSDGAVIWEARALGTSSGKVVNGAIDVNRQAMEGTGKALDALLSDLFDGKASSPNGRPAAKP